MYGLASTTATTFSPGFFAIETGLENIAPFPAESMPRKRASAPTSFPLAVRGQTRIAFVFASSS